MVDDTKSKTLRLQMQKPEINKNAYWPPGPIHAPDPDRRKTRNCLRKLVIAVTLEALYQDHLQRAFKCSRERWYRDVYLVVVEEKHPERAEMLRRKLDDNTGGPD